MNSHWHETIQRYVDGQSSAKEAAALLKGLKEDAELRALYLDYMNLDMALGAMADAAAVEKTGSNRVASLHEARGGPPPHYWRWTAAAAAALAVLVVFAMPPRVPQPMRAGQDVAAAIASAHRAIARLASDNTSALPAWMSPTSSLLETPRVTE
jgi:anti-sigma factor RsiW